jgi:hypothetical protein
VVVGRKIEKKVISDDLLFSDDFDENRLAKIEDELNRSPQPDPSKGKQRKRAEDGDAEEPPAPDPVPISSPPEDDPEPVPEASSEPPAESESEGASERQRQAVAKMVRSKRRLLLAATSVLVMVTTGLAYLLWPNPKQQGPLSGQIVRHRIVIPSYEFDTGFLIFVGAADKKKDLMKVDLELDFGGMEAFEQFKSRQILYYDVIYDFLRKQQPQDNSFQKWEEILERDLFESLKKDCPEIRLNSIHMKNFHRL